MMGPPTNMDEEPNRIVDVIEQESDDGSDDPKTVALENEENKFFEKTQTYPPVGEKQISNDVSLEEETNLAVDTEGVYRHRDLHGPGENFTYGGKKPLRENNLSDEDRANSLESVEILQGAKLLRSEKVTKARFEVQETSGKQKETKGQNKERNIGMQHSGLDGVRCPDANHKPGNGDSPKLIFSSKNSPSGHLKKKDPPENRSSLRNWKIFGPLKSLFAGMVILSLVSGAAAPPVIGRQLLEYDSRCSESGRSGEDDVLDYRDVQIGLEAGGDIFDGSGNNYTMICSNAFHHVTVKVVNLTNNLLQDLPPDIFKYTEGPKILYLERNKFTSFPPALNSSSDLRRLVLSDNNISVMPKYTMNGLTNLASFDLSGNRNMIRVPEDVFDLQKNYSLKSIFLRNTKIQHPLEPPPHKEVCTSRNLCNVTHREDGGVEIEIAGKKATFEFSQDKRSNSCEILKQQFESDYELVSGSVGCVNNVLVGSVNISRKNLTSPPEFTTEITKKDNLGRNVGISVAAAAVVFAIIVFGAIKCGFINKVRNACSGPSPNSTETTSSSDTKIDNDCNNISADEGQEQSHLMVSC